MSGQRTAPDDTAGWRWAGRGVLAAVLVFLYAPIAVMILFAFNRSPFYVLPIDWTTEWFVRAAGNDRLIDAALNSVAVALATAVIATTLGTMVALAFARYRFAGRRALQVLLLPPIAIPWLIIGTSMLIFFFWVGVGRGLHAMLLGHVALAIPYVVIVVSARLLQMPPVQRPVQISVRSYRSIPYHVAHHVQISFSLSCEVSYFYI